jgi:hypothetical protein
VVNAIIDRYASHPAVAGIEPSKSCQRDMCVVSAVFKEYSGNTAVQKPINGLAAIL